MSGSRPKWTTVSLTVAVRAMLAACMAEGGYSSPSEYLRLILSQLMEVKGITSSSTHEKKKTSKGDD